MHQQGTFTLMLSWSKEQQVYIGKVPDVVGVEGTGSTYEEALASLLEAMRWWRQRSGEGSAAPFSQMLFEDPSPTPEDNEYGPSATPLERDAGT